jgi:hypothetical protein
MNVTEAARCLSNAWRGAKWLNSVGVGKEGGKETIFVYVKRPPPKKLPLLREVAREFPIVVRRTGPLRPLVGHRLDQRRSIALIK